MHRHVLAGALACAAFLGSCTKPADTAAPTPGPAPAVTAEPIPMTPVPVPAVKPVPLPPPPPGTPAPEPTKASAAEEADCTAKGGTIQPVGLAGTLRCIIPYKDAGKACADGDDCEGDCWTASAAPGPDGKWQGTCQPTNSIIGCHGKLEDGELVGGIMCVD